MNFRRKNRHNTNRPKIMGTKAGSAPAKKRNRSKKPKAVLAEQFAKAPTVNIQGDYYFTEAENQALGLKLAGLLEQREQLQAHKKELMAQLKAQEEGITADIRLTGSKRRGGFEVRPMDVFVLFEPKKGLKHYHRKEAPHELIRSETMLPGDYEQELPMQGLPPSAKPPEAPAKPKAEKKKAAKPEGAGSPIGVTSFSDALNAVAAGKELKRVPVVIDEGFPPDKIRAQFRKAAKKFGWPVAAIELLDDEAMKLGSEQDDAPKVLDLFNAHTIRPCAEE